MTIIQHTNVDGYMSVRFKFKSKPNKEKLVKSLMEYHNKEEAELAADDLLLYGEVVLDDCSGTQYIMTKLQLTFYKNLLSLHHENITRFASWRHGDESS